MSCHVVHDDKTRPRSDRRIAVTVPCRDCLPVIHVIILSTGLRNLNASNGVFARPASGNTKVRLLYSSRRIGIHLVVLFLARTRLSSHVLRRETQGRDGQWGMSIRGPRLR